MSKLYSDFLCYNIYHIHIKLLQAIFVIEMLYLEHKMLQACYNYRKIII